jgi:predicted nucleotidyltransferase
MAEQIAGVPGVVGVVLGGSRARGDHIAASDVDLGIYYRGALDTDALGRLAAELSGPQAAVTKVGEWGPWVDGGGWLNVDGTPVDWIYRDLDRVDLAWERTLSGELEFHRQLGHPLGVPDFAYPGELALATVLADATGELRLRKERFAAYPPALTAALVRRLDAADFLLAGAAKAIPRQDTAYIAGCVFEAVMITAHALHGDAGSWVVNEKGLIASAGRLPRAPERFAARAHGALGRLGVTQQSLAASVAEARALVDDIRAATGG